MACFTVRWTFLTTTISEVRWGTFIRAISSKMANRTFYKQKQMIRAISFQKYIWSIVIKIGYWKNNKLKVRNTFFFVGFDFVKYLCKRFHP